MKTKLVFNINKNVKPYITDVNENHLFLETEIIYDLKEGDSKLSLRYTINENNEYEDNYKDMTDEQVLLELEKIEKEKVKLLEDINNK